MDRHLPLPRFRLETDLEENNLPLRLQTSRSHLRTRQSPCSDLQNTTIPEERIYNGDYRRSSLFIDSSVKSTRYLSKTFSDNQRSSKDDSQQSCQSLHQSLDTRKKTSLVSSTKESLVLSDKNKIHDQEDEFNYQPLPRRNYRYSLPDASPAALALKNLLNRNKTTKHNRFRLGPPSHSLHSLAASSSSSINSSSTSISTFRHFFSLVKLPSTTARHSSLTTLTNATGGSSATLDQTTSFISPTMQWHFETDKSQWCSYDGTSKIILSSIELHNLTYVEHQQLTRIVLQRLQSSQYDLGVSIHAPKEEPVRKRKHHFMFRSKSSEKSKENKDGKSNGNVFGVALSQCIHDDDSRLQDDLPSTTTTTSNPSGTNRKYSADTIEIPNNETQRSPSGSISSTNDSGCSISPASPSSLHIDDSDYEQSKCRSVSLEVLGTNEATGGINRMKTLRCYPAKVPELIKNCCDYLEKNALQTVGLFRVGVSKKRLKELKDQINSNRSLTFDSTTNAHDIAGLIKEFLRELPEPILTRDLCGLFLNIRTKLKTKDQSQALSYLISLLPSTNRDTLYTLLKFLYHVSCNSQDRYSTDGKLQSVGNKMDAANLAIIFAPTILMDGKAPVMSNKDTSVAMTADQMEQGKSILKIMIEQYKELFMVPKDLHDEVGEALYDEDNDQLTRALAFKVQNGCGITSIELDDTNERFLLSLDTTSVSCENPHSLSSTGLFQVNQQESTPRRYNLRRNSDFPRSSTHASRSSEYLQVPASASRQRPTDSTTSKSPRVRDIREARMDQIIFRVIDPSLSTASQHPTEPTINISSFDDLATSSDHNETPVPSNVLQTSTPLLREIKSYSRSKTAPLSSITGTQQFLSPKQHCEARDLCGSSSNDESTSPSTGRTSTPV